MLLTDDGGHGVVALTVRLRRVIVLSTVERLNEATHLILFLVLENV